VQYIIEGGKTVSFDNRYSVRKDRAHVPGQQDHVHVNLKGREMCVINMDGTPSHNSDISRIPRHLRPRLAKMGVKIEEANYLVESYEYTSLRDLLRDNIAAIERLE
jgi:hypothetical protein